MPHRLVVFGLGAVAAVTAVVLPLQLSTSASASAPRPAAPQAAAQTAARPQAAVAPAAARGASKTRTFPLTPTWLPYQLSLNGGRVEALSDVLWVSDPNNDHGAGVQITVVGADGLSSIDKWEHFRYSAATVNGLPATYAVATGSRAGEGYLLFQRAAGSYVLVEGHQAWRSAADLATLRHVATGLTARGVTGAAPALGTR